MHSQLAKQTLESKLSEITNPAGWRDSIAVRTSADPTGTTQQIGEREMACQSLSRSASLVRHLRCGTQPRSRGHLRRLRRLRRANRSEASGCGSMDAPLPILPESFRGDRSPG